jgi:hypothetical protein
LICANGDSILATQPDVVVLDVRLAFPEVAFVDKSTEFVQFDSAQATRSKRPRT